MQVNRIRVVELFFLGVLAAITYAFYQVVTPFWLDIFLATVLTAILYPLFNRLSRAIRSRHAAAGLIVVVVLVGVAVPVAIIGTLVYTEAVGGYSRIVANWPQLSRRLDRIEILEDLGSIPVIGEYLGEIDALDLEEILRNTVGTASNFVLNVTQQSFVSITQAVLHFAVVLFLMFFLFLEGPKLARRVKRIIPLSDAETDHLSAETVRITGATLVSTLLIGFIEGAFGTTLFIVFGLPSPFLWGLLMLIVSMIPLVGTNIILVPASVILIVTGRPLAGVVMLVLSLAGITLSQNLLKPFLLGGRSGLHPAVVLLSTIGGIAWLGLIGFLVGPLIASLFIVVWSQFGKRYRLQLERKNLELEGEEEGDTGGTEQSES